MTALTEHKSSSHNAHDDLLNLLFHRVLRGYDVLLPTAPNIWNDVSLCELSSSNTGRVRPSSDTRRVPSNRVPAIRTCDRSDQLRRCLAVPPWVQLLSPAAPADTRYCSQAGWHDDHAAFNFKHARTGDRYPRCCSPCGTSPACAIHVHVLVLQQGLCPFQQPECSKGIELPGDVYQRMYVWRVLRLLVRC